MQHVLGLALQHLVPGVNTRICAEDEMLAFARKVAARKGGGDGRLTYFRNGYGTFAVFAQAVGWRGQTWDTCGRWLDFAAGCGRVTRFLAAAAPGRTTICDIQDYAVEFQRDELGVEALVSTVDPEDLELPTPYDWISVVSLFTHLPERTFDRWLGRLARALAPTGTLLVTTVSGADEFQFQPISESRLDVQEYGRTEVSPARFRESAQAAGLDVLAMAPNAIGSAQDLWVLGRAGAEAPTAPFEVRLMPRIHVDAYRRAGEGGCEIGGWALDDRGHPLKRIVILDETGAPQGDVVRMPRADLAAEHGLAAVDGGWGARIAGPGPVAILGWAESGSVGFSAHGPATA